MFLRLRNLSLEESEVQMQHFGPTNFSYCFGQANLRIVFAAFTIVSVIMGLGLDDLNCSDFLCNFFCGRRQPGKWPELRIRVD